MLEKNLIILKLNKTYINLCVGLVTGIATNRNSSEWAHSMISFTCINIINVS